MTRGIYDVENMTNLKPTVLTKEQLFALLVEKFKDRPDNLLLSIGHLQLPDPNSSVDINDINLPEIQARVSIEMSDVRRWAEESR
jgi:hypothetical protein